MKRAAIILALLASTAIAADDWQAKCEAEGGCMMITQRAYDYLTGQLKDMVRAIERMKREQCA